MPFKLMRKRILSPASGDPTGPASNDWKPLFTLICIVLLGEALFLAAEKRIAGQWGFSLDDSWIHAAFARNLATGHGYSFNRGEWVAGSTAPLFTVLLALVYRIVGDIVWSAKALGIIFQCATAIVVFKSMQILNPARRSSHFVAGLVTGISPSLLWASLSGMEVSLYLFLAALGFYYYTSRRLFAATLVWALGICVRPDGVLLAVFGIASSRRRILQRLLVVVSVIVAYVAFNYAVGHEFLPRSVAAKTTLTLALVPRLMRILQEWAGLWGLGPGFPRISSPAFPILLLIVGGAVTVRRAPLLSLYCFCLPFIWSLFAGSTGIRSRYILYVIPPGVLLMVMGASALSNRFAPSWRRLTFAVLAGGVLFWESLGAFSMAEAHAWNVQNINGMQRRLGEMAKRMTQPGDALAVNDIGAIGYFSDRYVVDLMGLVSPLRSLSENLSLYKPRLLIIFPNWFRRYAAADSLDRNSLCYYDADSTHKYSALFLVQLAHNTVSARDKMCVFVRQGRTDPPPKHPWKYVF